MNSESLTPTSRDTVYVFEGFCLEPARRSLTSTDGNAVPLKCKPFDVLVYLLQHAGEVVDRAELLQAVWPRRVVEDNNVTQAIATLRRVLGAHHIATIPGRGYQFVTPVTHRATLEHRVEVGSEHIDPAIPAPEQTAAPTPAALPPQRLSARWVAIAVVALTGALLVSLLRPAEPEAALGAIAAMTPLTTYAGEEVTPAFSPDGTQIAFSWDGGVGNEDLYVTQVGTGAVARLTTHTTGADRYPAWSPDGQYIAFLRQLDATRFDVIVIPSIGGGQERKVYSGELESISREGFPLLAWTPDCSELWVTTRRSSTTGELHYGLHRISLTTGTVEALELGGRSEDYDTSPAISPDGRWIAFTRFRTGERLNQVMVGRLGPGFTPVGDTEVVATGALHHSLAWGPDSDRLWFVEGPRIFEWRVDGAARVVTTAGAQPSWGAITFTHDGRTARAAVVTRRSDTDIFALPLDPVSHAALGPPTAQVHSTATEAHPRFSPNGKQLAFVSRRSGHSAVWLADHSSGELRQLTNLTEFVTGFPRWSPDGTQLVFHTSAPNEERVIYLVSTVSGELKRLGNACCPGGWAADGKHIYVHDSGGINRIMRLDVEDGSTEVLFEGEMAVESADGRYLLYAKSRERGYFRRPWSEASGAGDEERLVSDYVPANGGLAAVADGFFYVGYTDNDRPRAIRFYDYALGKARDVWPAPPNVAIGLTVSPDGRELLFAADSAEPNADLALLEFTPP